MMIRLMALFLAAAQPTAAQTITQADFSLAGLKHAPSTTKDLWATYYFIHPIREIADGVPFRDKEGRALSGNIDRRQWCQAAIEGTVRIDGAEGSKYLSYIGVGAAERVDCAKATGINPVKKPWIKATGKSYFAPAKGRYGDGVAGYVLVPYRTIAVDKGEIPYGSVIYVPKARGQKIRVSKDVTIEHDGYFFAADKGGAIKGAHIDFFCGESTGNCMPALALSNPASTFEAWIVSDPAVVAKLKALHRPK